MDTRWQRGEITTFLILGILALIGAVTFLNTSLNQQPKTVNTNAQASTCPFDSGQSVPFGQTETNTNNMENRFPISANRHEYDFFSYFQPATIPEAQIDGMPVLFQSLYLNFQDAPPGATDSKVAGMMGKMFGYKPNQLADAYFMKYKDPAIQGADTLVKGSAPALKVPITPGDNVYMPATDYDIGGGKEAMVVFAADDRITLHLSRAEFIVGSGGNNCNGGPCSGGYWVYIRGICVDKQIQDAYNAKKGAQEAAGADKNPIELPMIDPGRILGKAAGNTVEVVVRDNGPLISIHKPFYWQGVPAKDFGTLPTATPVLVATATPTVPANIPTPTIPAGAICGYPSLRCCNPSDPVVPGVVPGTSCHPNTTCIGGNCLAPTSTPPIATQCGNAGQRCCNPSDPVPLGTICYSGLACTNNVCGAPATPTSTLTPTPQGTWTPTPTTAGPTPIRQNCLPLVTKGNNIDKVDIVFVPSNYSDYNKFRTDASDAIDHFTNLNLGSAVYDKFNFIAFTDVTRSYNVVQCDPANAKKQPCWNRAAANTAMRICNGDGYVIIQDTPKLQENPDLAKMAYEYWGQFTGAIQGLGSGEVLILRYDVSAIKMALSRAITGEIDNHTTQMWLNALIKFK